MSNTLSELIRHLSRAGLNADEAAVYAELSQAPSTHMKVSRATGINRTKVYRIVADLEAKGLVMRRSDDRGTFLTAGELMSLEEQIVADEAAIAERRAALDQATALMPMVRSYGAEEFVVHTYEGVDGMKQMQWHELGTKGVLRAFGFVTYEELVNSRRWAEDFRRRVVEARYETRELVSRHGYREDFTANTVYRQRYMARTLAESILPIHAPMVIYNDTVALYQVERQRKFGVEVVHRGFTRTMTHIFDHYWQLSAPL